MSKSSSSSTSSFNSDEEVDMRDLKPIKGYLSNRRELARQLFKSVKGEKIRMMLPQVLKNANLNDLEEWCAGELCGMSEARILCILKGQTMLNSSETSETDDSGPSLEIISDTEEWLTDTDVSIKKEPSSSNVTKSKKSKPTKSKAKIQGQKKTEQEKTKGKLKSKGNIVTPINADVKVKKEKEKESRPGAGKEGESLLDLLELEMRARAIRALIRKEEDIIPSDGTEKRMEMATTALRNTVNSAVSASLTSDKNLNGKFNLEAKTDGENNKKPVDEASGKSVEAVEDEDVVFVVVKPTPTIELLSSEGEDEKPEDKKKEKPDKSGEKKKEDAKKVDNSEESTKLNRRTQKNDTVPEIAHEPSGTERIVTIDKSTDGSTSFKIVVTKKISESSSSPTSGKSRGKKVAPEKREKISTKLSETEKDKVPLKIVELVESQPAGKTVFKKIRRKQNLRTKRKTTEDSSIKKNPVEESCENLSVLAGGVIPDEKKLKKNESPPEIPVEARIKKELPEAESNERVEVKRVEKKEQSKVVSMDEDRLDDFEEIIDLDDYPDDMEEMENNEQVAITPNESLEKKCPPERGTVRIIEDTIISTKENTAESAETWASRYYQTDDVQNVIKESKIQSEIRKRLRERQRLSKVNSSPKLNSPTDAGSVGPEKPVEKLEPKPTGSVQEYFALKDSLSLANLEELQTTDCTKEQKGSEEIPNVEANGTAKGIPDKNIGDEKIRIFPENQIPIKSPPKSSFGGNADDKADGFKYVIILGLLMGSAVFGEEAAKQLEDEGKDTKTKRGLELGHFGGFEHGGGFDGLSGLGGGGGGGGDGGRISSITIHREVKVPVPAPYTVEKKIPVPYPVHVKVPVDRPYPVHIPAPYPVHVEKEVPYPVEKAVPYPVKVPVKVPYKVPYPVEVPVKVPYPVHKEVPYPVKVPYYVKESYPVYVHAKHGHEEGGYASGFGYGGGHEHFDFGHH